MEPIDTRCSFLKRVKAYDVEMQEKDRLIEVGKSGDENFVTEKARMTAAANQAVLKHNLFHMKLPFPWKLHELLQDSERSGNEDVISWLPCGTAFKIHRPNDFTNGMMKKFFRMSKFKSFTRQVRKRGAEL